MSEPLRVLERLGDELERVARDGRRRRRPALPPRRILVLALITAGLVAATALAASGLLTGDPVNNPPGTILKADRGLGTPIPSTVILTGLRVPDPDGGLPWGLRTMRTTRGMACVQIGRVQDGRLGIIGQDGAFGDDGKFHELPPEILLSLNCQPTDGGGHGFIAISAHGAPASGWDPGCAPSPRQGAAGIPTCPPADARRILYGLLGPEGAAVTYDDEHGHRRTGAVAGPNGAYLAVLPQTATEAAHGHYIVPSVTPGSGLESVRYRDGSVCRIGSARRHGGARPCPPKGWVAPKAPRYTAKQLRTPVHTIVSPRPVRVPAPAGTPARLRRQRVWKVTVSFRATVRSDERGYYIILIKPDRWHSCPVGLTAPVSRDLRRGENVRESLALPERCRGRVSGTVRFHQPRRPEPIGPIFPLRDPVAGRFTITLPRR